MRKRWLERSQASRELSPLPLESPTLGGMFSDNDQDADGMDSEFGERMPHSLASESGFLGNFSDYDRWSVVPDDVEDFELDRELKKSRVQIEDVEGQSSTSLNEGAKKSAASQGVEHLAMKTANFGQFKFPWERKRLAGIFSEASSVKMEPPSLQPGANSILNLSIQVKSKTDIEPVVSTKNPPLLGPAFCKVVRNVDDLSYVDERAKRRSEAITAWWELLVTAITCSTVGGQATVDATSDSIAMVGEELLDACFSLKSPGTLWKRLYGIKSFYSWHLEHVGPAWLPMREMTAWSYVKHLRDSGAPPTKAATFLESCRFAWFILGVDGAGSIESSLRIKGISAQMKAKKRAWQPAGILTLAEVRKLHSVLEDVNRHITDRLLCGHALHLLYGRSRWSDLLAVQHVFMDECAKYFELQTQLHKGTKSADTRSKLLPVVTPCEGVISGNWAELYLSLREECGLKLPMEEPDHMMPAPLDESGKSWRRRYLTSEEGAEFLRLVLEVPKKSGRRISSHSLKPTTMSWASKFGLSLESRAILARHATAISNPTVLYSRDLLSPVLREYDAMLQAIRLQGFEPDKTRSGMITPAKIPVGTPGTPPSLLASAGIFRQQQMNAAHGQADSNSDARRVEVISQPGMADPESVVVSGDDKNSSSQKPPTSPVLSVLSSEQQKQDVESEGDGDEAASLLSETSEEASQQTTTSSEDEAEVKPALPLPSFSADCYYVNSKSLVLHCCRNATTFRCGRKISTAYCTTRELHGFRCSRCFDV